MGFYIEVPRPKNKVEQITAAEPSAYETDFMDAQKAMEHPDLGVIVVVDNGPFEAAGYCFSQREFEAFTDFRDTRPKRFVVMDKEVAERASGYARAKGNHPEFS